MAREKKMKASGIPHIELRHNNVQVQQRSTGKVKARDRPANDPIKCEAVVKASAQLVYAALTDRTLLRQWWSAWTECAVTDVIIDARQAGCYRIESRTRRNTNHFITGQFLHLNAGLVVFTWATDYSSGFASTVYVAIEAASENESRISIEHRGLLSELETKIMTAGWARILGVMQRGMPRLDENRVQPEVAGYIRQNALPVNR